MLIMYRSIRNVTIPMSGEKLIKINNDDFLTHQHQGILSLLKHSYRCITSRIGLQDTI